MRALAIEHPSGHWIVISHDNDWLTSVPGDDMGDFIAACLTADIDLSVKPLGEIPKPTRYRVTERGYKVQAWAFALTLAAIVVLAGFIQ